MIYTISIDGRTISSTMGDWNQIHYNGKLSEQANAAGQLTFSFPFDHVSYVAPYPMSGVVTVERDGEVVWFGRVLSFTEDKNRTRTFTCEGGLAFFNDVITENATSMNLRSLIYYCNANGGYIPFSEGNRWDIILPVNAGETAMQALSNYIKNHGGYFATEWKNGGAVLHYYDGAIRTASQEVRFGDNLVDITTTLNPTYLRSNFEKAISVKAFDKSLRDNVEPFRLLDNVRVVSVPHSVDELIIIDKLETDLNNANAASLSLGKTIKPLSEII